MSFANKLWANGEDTEEIGTSIMTPAGLIEDPEVVWTYRLFHDRALAVL